MIKPKLASLGLIGLAYGTIMVMGAADAPAPGSAPATKAAAKQAGKAAKALGKRDAVAAVAAAETAVIFAPREAGYRMLLGQSYLQAGRFQSAAQAFADTLTLDASNAKAALNLALAQSATGDWQAARATLAAHPEIPASDRGLAMALAGDPAGAVALLTDVARSPAATPKVRQNLALSYALGGQWQAARVVAATDLSPADVDARLQQWAAFVQPDAASAQVASLLGVRPVADGGQPVALALVAPMPMAPPVAVAAAVPVEVAPVPRVQEVAVVPVAVAPRIVQAVPAVILRPVGPTKVRVAAVTKPAASSMRTAFKPASGSWFVQLGAFRNAGVARDAWSRATRRFASFGAHQPNGVGFTARGATFYRLSVGGFSRQAADQACRGYRARGGACFVRSGAGDQIAGWVRKTGVQVASR